MKKKFVKVKEKIVDPIVDLVGKRVRGVGLNFFKGVPKEELIPIEQLDDQSRELIRLANELAGKVPQDTLEASSFAQTLIRTIEAGKLNNAEAESLRNGIEKTIKLLDRVIPEQEKIKKLKELRKKQLEEAEKELEKIIEENKKKIEEAEKELEEKNKKKEDIKRDIGTLSETNKNLEEQTRRKQAEREKLVREIDQKNEHLHAINEEFLNLQREITQNQTDLETARRLHGEQSEQFGQAREREKALNKRAQAIQQSIAQFTGRQAAPQDENEFKKKGEREATPEWEMKKNEARKHISTVVKNKTITIEKAEELLRDLEAGKITPDSVKAMFGEL